ncbi:MAG: DUF4383 domain-containing protein [Candidatus Aenigmarchaeota archaeon]|nr:DUF4383 domain-containing protein [Candidatus Aenigmarchaeota archaeon]
MAEVQKTYAMVIGAVLLLVGLLGFVMSSPLLGLFGVNTLQNVLHLIGGALGLYFGYKGGAKNFNLGLGAVALVVAVLGFVTPDLLAQMLNINMATTWLHVLIGVTAVGVGYFVKD